MGFDSEKYSKYYEKYEPVLKLEKDNTEVLDHYRKHNYLKCDYRLKKCGQIFLYETLLSKNSYDELCYPQIGIYLNTMPCDQTIEIEWAKYRRTWEGNREFEYHYNGRDLSAYYFEINTRIDSIILWHDSLFVYEVWDSMPSWKELRKAYDKTWWFHKTKQQKRDNTISAILNNE